MKIYNTILTEKQHKKSTLYLDKIIKYEYLTDKEILPFEQSKIIA